MWKIIFLVAAVFNFAAGLPMLLAPAEMLSQLQIPVPADLLFYRVSGLLVVCFGVIYALIALELERYRPLVWLGVIGKAGVVVLFGEAYSRGVLPFEAFALSMGDGLFVVLFLLFLFSKPRVA